MSKKNRFVKRNPRGDKSKKMSIITFGKPEPVLTTGTDYRDIWYDNAADHFTQPIDRLALAQLINLNGQHGGIIHARKNMIVSDYLGGGLTPAGLAGIVPQNTAGLGDVEKAERIYKKSEIAPIQRRFMTAVNNDPEIPERLHLNFDLSYTESTDKDAA